MWSAPGGRSANAKLRCHFALARLSKTGQCGRVADSQESSYEAFDLRAARPYLIVGDAAAAIDFYAAVFGAEELERHTTAAGGVGHAKFRIGETIVEIGEHQSAMSRAIEALPRVGLRLYVGNVAETFAAAITNGATGEPPSERLPGTRSATIYDPFGLTWWLVEKIATR
ncbi:MAG: glyoxalase [Ilumatobacteraceae bacterium]|nr:glyoxalase [Ilumatobacteraceae bacterium]